MLESKHLQYQCC